MQLCVIKERVGAWPQEVADTQKTDTAQEGVMGGVRSKRGQPKVKLLLL